MWSLFKAAALLIIASAPALSQTSVGRTSEHDHSTTLKGGTSLAPRTVRASTGTFVVVISSEFRSPGYYQLIATASLSGAASYTFAGLQSGTEYRAEWNLIHGATPAIGTWRFGAEAANNDIAYHAADDGGGTAAGEVTAGFPTNTAAGAASGEFRGSCNFQGVPNTPSYWSGDCSGAYRAAGAVVSWRAGGTHNSGGPFLSSVTWTHGGGTASGVIFFYRRINPDNFGMALSTTGAVVQEHTHASTGQGGTTLTPTLLTVGATFYLGAGVNISTLAPSGFWLGPGIPIVTTGAITAGKFYGDGSALSGIAGETSTFGPSSKTFTGPVRAAASLSVSSVTLDGGTTNFLVGGSDVSGPTMTINSGMIGMGVGKWQQYTRLKIDAGASGNYAILMANSNYLAWFDPAGTTVRPTIRIAAPDRLEFILPPAGMTMDTGGNAPRMFIDADGNVGISTRTPALPLDVGGAAQFGSTAKSTFTATGALQMAVAATVGLGSRTKAQLEALTPAFGEVIACSDCLNSVRVVIGTTTLSGWDSFIGGTAWH